MLYEAIAGGGSALADWGADLLLRTEHALEAGYSDSYYWRTRELLLATGEHMTDQHFAAVEARLLALEPGVGEEPTPWSAVMRLVR